MDSKDDGAEEEEHSSGKEGGESQRFGGQGAREEVECGVVDLGRRFGKLPGGEPPVLVDRVGALTSMLVIEPQLLPGFGIECFDGDIRRDACGKDRRSWAVDGTDACQRSNRARLSRLSHLALTALGPRGPVRALNTQVVPHEGRGFGIQLSGPGLVGRVIDESPPGIELDAGVGTGDKVELASARRVEAGTEGHDNGLFALLDASVRSNGQGVDGGIQDVGVNRYIPGKR